MKIVFYPISYIIIFSCLTCLIACSDKNASEKIDRSALVNRHNVNISRPDSLNALSVGNGEFAFTVDITGMQSFPELYENGIPLGTQSQWAWHSFPNDDNFVQDDVLVNFSTCKPDSVSYAVQHNTGRAAEATNYLRGNPQRIHMGFIGMEITNNNGEKINVDDIENIDQQLNLWTGIIESRFEVEGKPVSAETICHQDNDLLTFKISSPLIESNQLRITLKFPAASDCAFCPGYDWDNPESHESKMIRNPRGYTTIERTMDSTKYFVITDAAKHGKIEPSGSHEFIIEPNAEGGSFECSFLFTQNKSSQTQFSFDKTKSNSTASWRDFWQSGGAIDFSGSTHPQAEELERRIILSQYLTKIQCAGSMPPQETGLTFNSWYGKFHLEMHWWHAAQFALWGRPELLEKSLDWYSVNLDKAKQIADRQGYEGVRWPKMTAPGGLSSPSNVGEFLIWQQPHIIYFAELMYRADPSEETLKKYKELVFETADFMASFARLDKNDGYYHLCPPLIPAQEHFKAVETSDPAFELTYWHWGLGIALKWRERLGLAPDEKWQEVRDKLAPVPADDTDYLPTAQAADAFTNFDKRRDHPIVVGAYGMLPNERTDLSKMAHTFDNVMNEWNWESTWGWDYPLLAMTAVRLNKPEAAIRAILTDTQKNTYLVNGHNYQDARLTIYLPGNGGLLAAAAMMAAGSEDSTTPNPGFPDNGEWQVKWEGLKPMF